MTKLYDRSGVLLFALAATAMAGCGEVQWGNLGSRSGPTTQPQPVPAPISLLLPKTIRIHPFTGTRTFDEAGGVKGIDVRVEAVDSFGDATKAFGEFRFVLHQFRPNSQDPKGKHIATWEVSLIEPKANLLHWDNITRAYEFKLQWDRPIPVGQRLVLVCVFASPFTDRQFAERVFVSGQ